LINIRLHGFVHSGSCFAWRMALGDSRYCRKRQSAMCDARPVPFRRESHVLALQEPGATRRECAWRRVHGGRVWTEQ
jgi:hypothetical protein